MKKILLTCLLTGLASTAHATLPEPAKSGYFIGGQVGYAAINSFKENPNPGQPFSYNTGRYAWGLNAGYNYAITPYVTLGLQADYLILGETRYTDINNLGTAISGANFQIKSRGWDGLLTSTVFLGNTGLNLSAKGGVAQITQLFYGGASEQTVSNNVQYLPEATAALGYMWRTLNFTIEYRHIFGKKQNIIADTFNLQGNDRGQFTNNSSIDAVFLGATYQFNLD